MPDLRSVCKEGDDSGVGACDKKHPNVPSSNALNSGEQDIADHDQSQTGENVSRPFPASVGMPGVADDHKESENL